MAIFWQYTVFSFCLPILRFFELTTRNDRRNRHLILIAFPHLYLTKCMQQIYNFLYNLTKSWEYLSNAVIKNKSYTVTVSEFTWYA